MVRPGVGALSLVAWASPLGAQISATLRPFGDGSTQTVVRNNAAVGLTPFAVSVRDGVLEAPITVYADAEIDAPAARISCSIRAPPTVFVEQETANRQRVALAESRPSLAEAALIRR